MPRTVLPVHKDPTTMTQELENISTKLVTSRADIYEAAKLCKKYCIYPVKNTDIQKYLSDDRWTYTELLTDIVKNPKIKGDHGSRENVGFVMFWGLKKPGSKLGELILGIRYFALEPWYDTAVAVKWVKYVANTLIKEKKEFVEVQWPVDEYDTPLQEALKNEGFKAVKSFQVSADMLFRNGMKEEMLTRILFALD